MSLTAGAPRTDASLIARICETVASLLPATWQVTAHQAASTDGAHDGRLTITRSAGEVDIPFTARFGRVARRDALALADRLESTPRPMLVAPFLAASTREALTEVGISFADATGNVRIDDEDAGLFVRADGATRDPWVGPGRPRAALRGEPAAKMVRTLIDVPAERWRVSDLLEAADLSVGAGYRVLGHLDEEGFISRPARGVIEVNEWSRLLRAWSAERSFAQEGETSQWLAPRGLNSLLVQLASLADQDAYAVTGSVAAHEWAPYAPARLAQIYVRDAEGTARALGLRAARGTGNVVLCETPQSVPFLRTGRNADGVTIVAPAQAVADLATSPGRGPAEGEELLRWMETHEQSWRD